MHEKQQLLLFMSETWFRGQSDPEIKIEEYKFFRSDKKLQKKNYGRNSRG